MVDMQATERALRIGQTRNVAIYRFVTEDSIEEKVYHRQIFKKFMADRVLADPSRRRLFEKDTLYNLLELPARCKHINNPKTADTSSESDETVEEGQLMPRRKKRNRDRQVKVITEKKIRKNKKFQDFEA